jgi:tetratricopeptide (TPR) repeat protein
MAYVAANRNPDAEKALAEALKRNPKDLDALELRSRLYLGAGNIDKAQEDAAQLIHFRADSPMAHYLMAKVHQAKRATGNYEQELGEALRLSPAFLTARLELSQSMRAANHAKNALELLEKAPDQQKQSLPVIVERNWVYLALGKEADLRAGIAEGMKFGRSPNLMLQDALLSLRGKNLAGARVTLEEILKQNPEDFRAFQVLLSTYVAQNQTAAALAKLKEYAAQRPKSPAMQFFVGQWMAVTGDRKGAREAFQQAKALNPAFREAEISLAQLDMAEGKLDAARQSLTRLASADSRNPALSLMLSMVEEKAGNYPAAVGHLRATVAADPSNVLAMNNLAYLLAEQMKAPDEALPFAQKALESDPKAPFINDTIGWVYYQKGMYRRAVQHIETAVAGQPTARRKYHLAMACEKNGDHKRAVGMLKEALTMDPNLPEAAAASSLVASSR